MIAEILSRKELLPHLSRMLRELQLPPDDRRGPEAMPAQISHEEMQEAASHLAEALAREREHASLYPTFDETAERSPDAPALEDRAFFSSDPIISLAQSAIEETAQARKPAILRPSKPPDDRRGGAEADPIGAISVSDDRRLFGAFSETDARWAASLFAMGYRWFSRRRPFPPQAATAFPVAENARLIVVGDWASGLPRAQKVATAMRARIEEAQAERREVHVIHLGDVYYSGWPNECEKRFLRYWPAREGEAGVYSWNLNGNHDMYCGGKGYFETVLDNDGRFAKQEHSSRFILRHPEWEILGLDTAYVDHDISEEQARWAIRTLEEAAEAGRKGMLLSHHQLFSAFEGGGEKLAGKLASALQKGRVRAWLWGHEHRCAFYESHQGVAHARCLGHGGVPVYQWRGEGDPVPPPATYEFRGAFRTTLRLERWAKFGFAVYDFAPGTGKLIGRHFDEDGVAHHPAGREEDILD